MLLQTAAVPMKVNFWGRSAPGCVDLSQTDLSPWLRVKSLMTSQAPGHVDEDVRPWPAGPQVPDRDSSRLTRAEYCWGAVWGRDGPARFPKRRHALGSEKRSSE